MLFSPHDPWVIREKLLHSGLLRRINPFALSEKARVKARWNPPDTAVRHWYQIPLVISRVNRRVSGDSRANFHDFVCSRYFNDGKKRRALSLGCGSGDRELEWARRGVFYQILGLDLSPHRIARANSRAAEENFAASVKFEVNDVNSLNDYAERFDVVLFEHSLHHFTGVGMILEKVKRLLAPGGLLIVDEFVGPRRFQWTPAQLALADGLLLSIPEQYRRFVGSNRTKNRNLRAGTALMWLNDPSEAVESDAIAPELERQYAVLARRNYGGTICQLLFQDIAHHFGVDDGTNFVAANRVLDAEEDLIARGVISSDYAAFVCSAPES